MLRRCGATRGPRCCVSCRCRRPQFLIYAALYEPGANTAHTLRVEAVENCGTAGGNSGGRFTIDSVSIDVIGVR